MNNRKIHIHNNTNLEACYDQQLPLILGLFQESVGVDYKCIKVIINVLTAFKHYICTSYGISSEHYSDDSEDLAGNGQGNLFAGAACKDLSRRGFKALEEKQYSALLE